MKKGEPEVAFSGRADILFMGGPEAAEKAEIVVFGSRLKDLSEDQKKIVGILLSGKIVVCRKTLGYPGAPKGLTPLEEELVRQKHLKAFMNKMGINRH